MSFYGLLAKLRPAFGGRPMTAFFWTVPRLVKKKTKKKPSHGSKILRAKREKKTLQSAGV